MESYKQRITPATTVITVLCISFLWPMLFIYAPGELANLRNWHLLFTAIMIGAIVLKKIDLDGLLHAPISSRQWQFLAGASLLSFSSCVLLQFFAFRVNGMDFSIFDWMLYNSNHRSFMTSPVCNHCNHFGIHPSYIMLPLVPLHRWFTSPLLLQFVHAIALWVAQFPLRRLAEHWIKEPFIVFFVVFAFLVNSWTGSILNHGFHFEVLYVPIGFALILSWVKQRTSSFILLLLAFLCIKEDAALYVAAFLTGALVVGDQRRRLAIFGIFTAVLFATINLKFAQPYFLAKSGIAQPLYVTRFWGKYGGDKMAIVIGMLRHPHWVLMDVLGAGWVGILGSMLFLPLLTMHAVIAFLPFIFLNGTASTNDQQMRDFAFYYSSPFLPFVFWGLLSAAPRLEAILRKVNRNGTLLASRILFLSAVLFALNTGGYQKFPKPRLDVFQDVQTFKRDYANSGGVFCVQLALFPHLPYEWDLNNLDTECQSKKGSYGVFAPELDPNPYTKDMILQMSQTGAIERRYPSGLTVTRKTD